MAKKSSGSQRPSPIGILITAIVIAIAALVSRFAGDGNTSTATPPATSISVTSQPQTQVASVPGQVSAITVPQGFGAGKGFWRVFFTAPTGSSDAKTYVGGIDTQLAADIATVTRTLDIAAFEFNNEVLTQAILDAKARGVVVRIVTDNEHGIEDTADKSLSRFQAAGIPIVDDSRSNLMHNKFMILDSTILWTGSWNYTVNDTYRNNNNAIALRSRRAVESYQAEFNEMFNNKSFGPRSTKGNNASFTQDGVPIQIYFAPEDEVVPAIISTLQQAKTSIRFMAFSFTLDDVGAALLNRASNNVSIQGIVESRQSTASFGQLTPLFCAGLNVRQDGNKYVLHHKVFIVDNTTVIAGSFNFSASARDGNDENLFIIQDADLAAQYIAEFDRRWNEATVATGVTCR